MKKYAGFPVCFHGKANVSEFEKRLSEPMSGNGLLGCRPKKLLEAFPSRLFFTIKNQTKRDCEGDFS